ncbi:hypothetical protein GCM10023086_75350 [Streptomyces venetus]|uniref:Uncharacterized protein n=1 Tax=Streptomyces venetus TaxID=1701086 RepID=A0ABP8HJ10_9ACTN
MSAGKRAAALMVAAGFAVALATPASAAEVYASDWYNGLGSNYAHSRTTAPGTPGAAVYAHIFWNGTRVGVDIETTDTKRDGRGAVAFLSYEVKIGREWLSASETMAHASGGFASKGYKEAHSKYPTRYLSVMACTVKSGSFVKCSDPA